MAVDRLWKKPVDLYRSVKLVNGQPTMISNQMDLHASKDCHEDECHTDGEHEEETSVQCPFVPSKTRILDKPVVEAQQG